MPRIATTPGVDGRAFTMFAGNGRTIGIGVTALTKQLASHYGVESGLLINDVRDGSPAFKAGLKAGDIIVEAEGKAVKRDFDLIKTIQEKKEGDVQLTFVRDGKRQTVSVTPEASKGNGFVFETNEENGFTPFSSPGEIKVIKQMKLSVPMTAPSPPIGFRPGRIL
jgi:membrane-associated protease RseP (regulator of RpoE activity)